jgi:hypothetical protein
VQTCQRHAGSGVELPSRVGLEVLTTAVERHWNQARGGAWGGGGKGREKAILEG